MLKITAYSQKLLDGLDEVDYLPRIKMEQRNWIGRSEGAEMNFPLSVEGKSLKIFTTRPDTIYGATFMVIAPEHPIVEEIQGSITNMDQVREYQDFAAKKERV